MFRIACFASRHCTRKTLPHRKIFGWLNTFERGVMVMDKWVAYLLVAILLLGLVAAILTGLRHNRLKDADIRINTEFDLRALPPGPVYELESEWVKDEDGYATVARVLTLTDMQIAFEVYTKVIAQTWEAIPLGRSANSYRLMTPQLFYGMVSRREFVNRWDFVRHLSFFDPNLPKRLAARKVDPSEYDWDTSGWDDDENDR